MQPSPLGPEVTLRLPVFPFDCDNRKVSMLLVPSEDPLLLRALLLCSNTNVGAYVEPALVHVHKSPPHRVWFVLLRAHLLIFTI